MKQPTLDSAYWSERYRNNSTRWDVGSVSTPIKSYIDQLENISMKILVPGCGKGYEGIYLWERGFKNTYFLDYSPIPLQEIQEKHPDIPLDHFFVKDFFELKGTFDLLIEQTLFCAIEPSLRSEYAKQVAKLLAPHGKLVGVLFNKEFEDTGPPFGGTKEEYLECFKPYFQSIEMESCYNSIPPRQGTEIFVKMSKPKKP